MLQKMFNILIIMMLISQTVFGITCPQDGDWPETEQGEIASIVCSSGLYGKKQRLCMSNGGVVKWEEPFDKNCRIFFIN